MTLRNVKKTTEYLLYSKDVSLFYEVKDKISEVLDTFVSRVENGLISTFEGACHWNFYDWSPYSEGALYSSEAKKSDCLLNCLLIIALDNYKAICEIVNEQFGYEDVINRLRLATKEAFFDKGKGLFLVREENSYTELTNSFAILAKLCTQDEEKAIAKALAGGDLISCSLSFKCFKYDALLSVSESYKDTVLKEIRDTYSKMAARTNTVWETHEGESAFDNAGSLCHGWSAIPIYYYNTLI